MNTFLAFLFTLAVVGARPSYSSLEGYGYGHGYGYGQGHGGGEPKLISQSVHLKEIPTKIIRVTKTAVIKVPVPYPVKVPHHIPIPVPVKHPVAVPYPQVVKVLQQVPVEVTKTVPIELPQQVPLLVPRPITLPHPVPVPHPVPIDRPFIVSVPHPIPYQSESHDAGVGGYGHSGGGYAAGYGDGEDHVGHESAKYSSYTVNNEQAHGGYDQQADDQSHFQPSQPDYTPVHH